MIFDRQDRDFFKRYFKEYVIYNWRPFFFN